MQLMISRSILTKSRGPWTRPCSILPASCSDHGAVPHGAPPYRPGTFAPLVLDADRLVRLWCRLPARAAFQSRIDRSRRKLHNQGSQYTSEQFQRLLTDHGVICSMSKRGDCWDNAAMESFFSSLKTERVARTVYRTRDEPRTMCSPTSRGLTIRREGTQRSGHQSNPVRAAI